jgi:hypothetical protein
MLRVVQLNNQDNEAEYNARVFFRAVGVCAAGFAAWQSPTTFRQEIAGRECKRSASVAGETSAWSKRTTPATAGNMQFDFYKRRTLSCVLALLARLLL